MYEVNINAKCETVQQAFKLLSELENLVGKSNADLEYSEVLDEEGSVLNNGRPEKPKVGDLVVLLDEKMAEYVGSKTPIVMRVFDSLDEDWGDDGEMAVAQREFEQEIGEAGNWYAIIGDQMDQAVIGDHEAIAVIPKS